MKSPLIAVFGAIAVCLAALGVMIPRNACADSWAPPTTEVTFSENGEYRFTVEPSPLGSSLQYFSEEIEARRDGRKIDRPGPIGLLERRDSGGDWQPVWADTLANAVAPVSTLVANDGRYIVTFDNWHGVGRGEDVIVIYGPDGELVRSMMLTELVPESYVEALSHTVSSTRWKTGAALRRDGRTLVIDVIVPGDDSYRDDRESVSFGIALEDGRVSMPDEADWEAALCAADTVNEMRDKAEQDRLAYLRDPLAAPAGCDMGDWHDYLREAHMRLAPDYLDDGFTSTTVLFPSDHPRHAESVGWLKERMLDEWEYPRAESFVSPCEPEALVMAIRLIMASTEPRSLPNATFYVSAPESTVSVIRELIRPSGAKLVWLDPKATIPQRPERIPGSVEERTANEERIRRSETEMAQMLEEMSF